MAQRKEPKDSLDLFPTPPWATRALCEALLIADIDLKHKSCWEPACGNGDMVKALREYFVVVHASDVHAHVKSVKTHDFLMPGEPLFENIDWVISNPPFRLAEQFVERALDIALDGVAMLVRLSFLEGVGRYQRLFSKHPPMIFQFTERVTMVKGRLEGSGGSATAYCWLVWRKGFEMPDRFKGVALFGWLGPCRKLLERASDYEVAHG